MTRSDLTPFAANTFPIGLRNTYFFTDFAKICLLNNEI